MTFVCLWNPRWPTDAASPPERIGALLEAVPRVAVEQRGVLWADARGLPAVATAERLRERLGEETRAGVAAVPIAAEVAARTTPVSVCVVPAGAERSWLAPHPLALLGAEARLLTLLDGVGITRCAALAALDGAAVEVRFGAAGAALWQLARGRDPRPIFRERPRELPHASLDWVDYVVSDPARLAFTANALLGTVCTALGERGEATRCMELVLILADGSRWNDLLRTARPTAERTTWLRRVRARLDSLSLPDAVTGVALRVAATEPATVRQGDLFDRGSAGREAREAAIGRLLDARGPVVVTPVSSRHPLLERRTRWRACEPEEATLIPSRSADARLALQLVSPPRPVWVHTEPRRDHRVPVRLRDGAREVALMAIAGPDRVSGGEWEGAYAREYFRVVTAEGALLWLFRDALEGAWYCQGWWD